MEKANVNIGSCYLMTRKDISWNGASSVWGKCVYHTQRMQRGERIYTQDETEGRNSSKNIFSKFFKEFLP